MGTCIKCGKETKNQYDCYSADVVVESNIARQIDRYSNFEHHQDYVCNLCICEKGQSNYNLIISIILLPVSIGLLVYGSSSQENWALIVGGVLGLFSIYTLFTTIRSISKKNTDDRMDEKDDLNLCGERSLINYLVSKNPQAGRQFLTPEEYESLSKQ